MSGSDPRYIVIRDDGKFANTSVFDEERVSTPPTSPPGKTFWAAGMSNRLAPTLISRTRLPTLPPTGSRRMLSRRCRRYLVESSVHESCKFDVPNGWTNQPGHDVGVFGQASGNSFHLLLFTSKSR
jgi:hypothetical protein